MHNIARIVAATIFVITWSSSSIAEEPDLFGIELPFEVPEMPDVKLPDVPQLPDFWDLSKLSKDLTVELGLGDFLTEVTNMSPALEGLGYDIKVSDIRLAPPSAKIRLRSALIDNADKLHAVSLPENSGYIASSILEFARTAKQAQVFSGLEVIGIEVLYTAPSSIGFSVFTDGQEELTTPCGP